MEFKNNIVEHGRKDGLEWSKTAHYSDIQYALWEPDEGELPVKDEKLGAYFSQMFKAYKERLAATGRQAQSRLNELSQHYLDGWKEGVELFWDQANTSKALVEEFIHRHSQDVDFKWVMKKELEKVPVL